MLCGKARSFFCLFAAVAADGGPIINLCLVSSVTSSTTTTTRMTTTTRLQNHTRVHTERLSGAAVRIDNAGGVISYYWLNQTVWWKHVSLPFCLLYCTARHCRLYGQWSGVHASSWRVSALDANVHRFTCRFARKNKHSAPKGDCLC